MAEAKLSDATKKLWEGVSAADADLETVHAEHDRDLQALTAAQRKENDSADRSLAKLKAIRGMYKQLIASLVADAQFSDETSPPSSTPTPGPAPEEDDGTY